MPLPPSPLCSPSALLSFQPTPLPSLRPANLEPAAEAVEVGRLILKAAEWSPQSHELFPEAARKRAVEVMRLGYLIAWDEERFDGREGAAPELADIWRGFVLPRVVGGALRRRVRIEKTSSVSAEGGWSVSQLRKCMRGSLLLFFHV